MKEKTGEFKAVFSSRRPENEKQRKEGRRRRRGYRLGTRMGPMAVSAIVLGLMVVVAVKEALPRRDQQ